MALLIKCDSYDDKEFQINGGKHLSHTFLTGVYLG